MDHHKPLAAGMGELEDLRKQLEREVALRKQAEAVLVSRTKELDSANKELIALNESLEVKIEERTKQAEESELRYRSRVWASATNPKLLGENLSILYLTNSRNRYCFSTSSKELRRRNAVSVWCQLPASMANGFG